MSTRQIPKASLISPFPLSAANLPPGFVEELVASELGTARAEPELLLITPDGQSRWVRLEESSLSLGRSSVNDLSVPEDKGLSRRHLVSRKDGDRWAVANLDSKNGTFVNGARITDKHFLQSGERIAASCVMVTFLGPQGKN